MQEEGTNQESNRVMQNDLTGWTHTDVSEEATE